MQSVNINLDPFSALTLLVGRQKGRQTCKRTLLKQSTKVLRWTGP